jgi:thiamine transport system permease protein
MFNQFNRFKTSMTLGLGTAIGLIGLIALFLALLFAEASGTSSGLPFDYKLLQILGFTFFQAMLSTALALALGLLFAWSLSHNPKFIGRSLLVALLSVSMVLPTLVAVLGLVTVWGRRGWFNDALDFLTIGSTGSWIYGLGGILLAHTYLNAPFMARTILQRLEAIPAEQRKLARALNLSSWQRFQLMEWQAIKGSLPGLCSTVFLLCFTSFAIVLTLGGSTKFNTLEVAIYEAIKLDFDIPRAVVLALTQLGVCAVLVTIASSFKAGSDVVSTPRQFSAWPEFWLERYGQWVAIALFSIFFVAPLIAIVVDGASLDLFRVFGDGLFLATARNSLILASFSALLTLSLALILANAKRNTLGTERLPQTTTTSLIRHLLAFSGSVYLAVPSLVMAFGFFLLARQLFGSVYLVAPFALILANALLALPFALAVLGPALEKTAARHDRLAFSLRLSEYSRWRLLDWPLIKSEVLFVLSLAFCFSLGDFGIISLFGSQDFATLPWMLYQKIGSYRTDEASAIALVLLAITLAVFLGLPKLIKGSRNA